MATDPFADIKRPICGEFVEIGQPTFAELIWAQSCRTAPAIGRSAPDVRASLRNLAFGKPCTDRLTPQITSEAGIFEAVVPPDADPAAGFSYDIRQKNTGSAYKQKIRNLGAAKQSVEFKQLIANSLEDGIRAFELLDGCPGDCPDPCPPPGDDDLCAVDFCVCLDTSGSMSGQIAQVKTGIDEVAEFLRDTVGNNYRFSLLAFADNVYIVHRFGNECGTESLNAFKAALEPVNAGYRGDGGGDFPEYSAAAVLSASTGGAGCWREGDVVRAIVVITDAPNDGGPNCPGESYCRPPDSGVSVTEAANAAAACNIRVAYAGSPGAANEGAIYAATTGGVNVRLASGGSGLKNLLQTFIFSLCSEFIPDPECEGGTNLALNGTFETDINGWDTTGTAVWDEDFESPSSADPILRSMRLDKGATAEQVYTDLEPGNLILLNYNWCLRQDLGGMALAAKAEPNPLAHTIEDLIKGPTPFIINPGQDPETGFPAVGKIGSIDGGAVITYFCSGTLIAPRFVLTAAHCMDGLSDTQVRIDFGGTVYSSVKIYNHPLWNETLLGTDSAYDIAIVELDADVTGITPLGISSFSGAPGTGPEPGIGDPVKLVGFGATGDDAGESGGFGTKRSGDQMIDAVSTQLLRYNFDVAGEASAAPGDSGGPVLFDDGGTWYIAGLVSGATSPAPNPPWAELGSEVFNTRVSAFDGWIFGVLSGDTQTIIGELRDSSDNPLPVLEGSGATSYEAVAGDCSTGRQTRPPIRARVPLDGIVKAHFELKDAAAPNTHWLYLDQIVVCDLANEDCGPGARNLIRNGNFERGVQEWTDESGAALPATDPSVWDNDIFAIIVNLTAESEVRQRITNLVPGRELTLSFEVTSYEPDIISELEIQYGILSDSNSVIVSDSATNATLQPTPKRLTLTFTVPPDGIIKVFFKTGAIGGVCKIRNVLLCDLSGVCEEGYDRVSFDEFETGKGSWSGGTYDPLGQQILLDDTSDTISQTFPGLTPGSIFQLSVNVRDSGGVVITLVSGGSTGQLLTPTSPGYYTTDVVVQEEGLVVATIQRQSESSDVNVDDVLTCVSLPEPCDGSVSDMQVLIEWDGIARQPVNFFNAIIRYTIRNPADPFDVTEVTYLPTSEGRLSITACDLWKSQIGSGDLLGSGLANIGEIESGDFASVAAKTDWLWNIPQNSGSPVQDSLVINFPDPGDGKLIENVEVLMLLNNAIPATGTNTPPVYPPPLACDPDPASVFNVSIRYTNSQRLGREFTTSIAKSDLWVQEADFSIGNPWDTDTAISNGIKGSSARWESVSFDLDTVDGRGLDQCTTSLFFRGNGIGDLVFQEFTLKGTGSFVDPCLSEVTVEDISSGSSGNEIQSIVLPTPSGGTWDLSFTRGTTETTTLPWDTTAAQIRVRLATLPNIGSTKNVKVTGSGTVPDPFLVEFTDNLGAIDHELMVADGSDLTGAGSAFVTTESNGTPNERQRIANPSDSRQDLIIEFNGVTSVPISYNSSLDTVQSSLEGMTSIGAGNVAVTGNISDREADYAGPYYVEFKGDLGNQNVPQMVASPEAYVVSTDWNGGPGAGRNEKQLLNLNDATAGTFNIRIFNADSSVFADTAPIAFNADAATVKSALVTAADFIESTDINVTVVTADEVSGEYIWRVEFVGTYARTNMPQMQLDGSALRGSDIEVKEVQKGFGSNDKQRVTVWRASAGSWKLTVTIFGRDYQTTAIPWNTTAAGLQAQLLALPPFEPGDLTVTDLPKTNAEQNFRVAVTFKKKFGNIPLMEPEFQETLLCNPIILPPVPPPPPLPLPECDELEDLRCSSGPLLCKPGPGDEPIDLDPCCDEDTIPDHVNISTRIKLERDLFDPNNPPRTIRDLALIKGLAPSNYTPYIRDFHSGQLTETSYDVVVQTKMSVLLVENELNTINGRRRIMNHIGSRREILPARFVWPDCDVTLSVPSEECWPGV